MFIRRFCTCCGSFWLVSLFFICFSKIRLPFAPHAGGGGQSGRPSGSAPLRSKFSARGSIVAADGMRVHYVNGQGGLHEADPASMLPQPADVEPNAKVHRRPRSVDGSQTSYTPQTRSRPRARSADPLPSSQRIAASPRSAAVATASLGTRSNATPVLARAGSSKSVALSGRLELPRHVATSVSAVPAAALKKASVVAQGSFSQPAIAVQRRGGPTGSRKSAKPRDVDVFPDHDASLSWHDQSGVPGVSSSHKELLSPSEYASFLMTPASDAGMGQSIATQPFPQPQYPIEEKPGQTAGPAVPAPLDDTYFRVPPAAVDASLSKSAVSALYKYHKPTPVLQNGNGQDFAALGLDRESPRPDAESGFVSDLIGTPSATVGAHDGDAAMLEPLYKEFHAGKPPSGPARAAAVGPVVVPPPPAANIDTASVGDGATPASSYAGQHRRKSAVSGASGLLTEDGRSATTARTLSSPKRHSFEVRRCMLSLHLAVSVHSCCCLLVQLSSACACQSCVVMPGLLEAVLSVTDSLTER